MKKYNEFEDVNDVLDEVSQILKYASKNDYKFLDLPTRLKRLNYLVADCDDYYYKRRHGRLDIFNMSSCKGVCIPFVNYDNVIDDIVIIISKGNDKNPLYVVHELLHFFSTNVNKKRQLICGIDNFDVCNGTRKGIIAINEGFTDYFAYKVCGNYYDKKYFKFDSTDEKVHKYHYSTLLINLAAYNNLELEKNLFKAYMTNNTEYIYSILEKSFGINRDKIEYLFERGEDYADNKLDDVEIKVYLKDVEKVIKYYYDNIYNNDDPDFVDNYLKLFK